MADTGDLKSPGLNSRAGSSPARGTNLPSDTAVGNLIRGRATMAFELLAASGKLADR